MAEILLNTVIVGSQFREGPAIRVLARLPRNETIRLEREPHNPFDPLAIACYARGTHVGYIPKQTNKLIAPALDRGCTVIAVIDTPAKVSDTGFIRTEARLRIAVAEPQL